MLPGWTLQLLADGIAMFPPGGRETGGIRMKERVRPLASVATIIAPVLEQAREKFDGVRLHDVERFTTVEGEYAAILTIAGNVKGKPEHAVERTIAIVFGDDFYQRYDAVIQDRQMFDKIRIATREFAFRSRLGLGEARRRRFLYTPPEGWQPLTRVMTTEWYPPDYPKDFCRIAIPGALPGQDPSVFDEVALLYQEPGYHREQKVGPHPVTTDHGLHGFVLGHRGKTPSGRLLVYEQVLFQDARFVYMLRFESDLDRYEEHHEIFKKMVRSVEPLPTVSRAALSDEFVHWAT